MKGYSCFMPYETSVCVNETAASSTTVGTTTCSYTQVAPYETYDPGITMGLAFLVLFVAATFIRNVFYR